MAAQTKIRFIVDKLKPAEFNMAADVYLLEQCNGKYGDFITVRFYSWARPCVTLGYMQSANTELNITAMQTDGVDWIKRPTGGRAVLHSGDITYSCVFSKKLSAVMGTGITHTYRIISKCLTAGLEAANIKCVTHDSDLNMNGVGRDVKLPCFLAPNRDEIMVDNRKLVGSAQKRAVDAVLQHGSIPISTAFRRLPEYLRIDTAEKERQAKMLIDKCCCVEELLQASATFEYLTSCLTDGFSKTLRCGGETIPWSYDEEAAISVSAI